MLGSSTKFFYCEIHQNLLIFLPCGSLCRSGRGTDCQFSFVLLLLSLLTSGTLVLGLPGRAVASGAPAGLKALHGLNTRVDECKAFADASSKRSLQSPHHDTVGVLHLVHGRQLAAQLLARHTRFGAVVNLKRHLTALEQLIAHNLARLEHDCFAHLSL